MEELNKQLDQTLLDIFQVLEDLYETQATLEQTLKDGFFSMARARYSMSVKRVSADQILDADLTANLTVHVNTKDVGEEVDTTENVPSSMENTFSLCRHNVLDKDKQGIQKGKDDEKVGKESGVRKRGTGKQASEEAKGSEKREKEEEDVRIKVNNPIKLFGVLVPQTLRSSQTSFERAMEISVEVANMKDKLVTLEKKLKCLKSEKLKISNSTDSSPQCVENES